MVRRGGGSPPCGPASAASAGSSPPSAAPAARSPPCAAARRQGTEGGQAAAAGYRSRTEAVPGERCEPEDSREREGGSEWQQRVAELRPLTLARRSRCACCAFLCCTTEAMAMADEVAAVPPMSGSSAPASSPPRGPAAATAAASAAITCWIGGRVGEVSPCKAKVGDAGAAARAAGRRWGGTHLCARHRHKSRSNQGRSSLQQARGLVAGRLFRAARSLCRWSGALAAGRALNCLVTTLCMTPVQE